MNSTGIFSNDVKRSQPFVKILDNKLAIVREIENLSPDTRVISILGKARMGKSTFLNLLITNIKGNTNQTIFTTQDSDEHCTRGIDAHYMPEKNILLLDSQGLAYEDSSHDPQLLLFLYYVSDVILFNDIRRLENGALKLLEPICTFSNYIDMDELAKPRLFFRIADSDVKEPEKNLEKVLGAYPDQYQSIRDSIRHLFHTDIRILPTTPLDKRVRALLNANEYKEVLDMEETGFREACQAIEETVIVAEKKSKLARLQDVIGKINGNEEIKIEKLDIVKLQAEREMTKWRDATVNPGLYMPIDVDGTQKSFDDAVKPRKNTKREILTNFTKRFKAIPETIREPFRGELDEKLGAPIRDATTVSERKAEERVAFAVAAAYSDKTLQQLNSMNNSFCTIPDSFWPSYFRIYEELRQASEDIYGPVKEKYVEWVDSMEAYVKGVVEKIRGEERAEAFAVEKLCETAFREFEDWAVDELDKNFQNGWLKLSNQHTLERIVERKYDEILMIGFGMVRRRTVTFTQTGRRLKEQVEASAFDSSVRESFQQYDLVREYIESFSAQLTSLIEGESSLLCEYLTMKKGEFLAGKFFQDEEILRANPEIQFIQDMYAIDHGECMVNAGYMTKTTFQRTHEILYKKCFEKLVKKGYAKEDEDVHGTILGANQNERISNLYTIKLWTCPRGYKRCVQEVYKRTVQKEFCKSVVAGFQFPEPLVLTS